MVLAHWFSPHKKDGPNIINYAIEREMPLHTTSERLSDFVIFFYIRVCKKIFVKKK